MIDWEARFRRQLAVENDPTSHTEMDPHTFHPSQLAKCKRQLARSKFGLETPDTHLLGTFKTGTLIHEWVEDNFADTIPGVHHEYPAEWSGNPSGDTPLEITGHADVYDEHEGVVYDFKSRASWYRFDPPTERHIDQLTAYMAALDADQGQVVYVSKKNLEVRTWPEDGTFTFDSGRFSDLLGKALEVASWAETHPLPEDESDLPWDTCGCFICSQED